MTDKEVIRSLRSIGAALGDVEDYVALKQADRDLVQAALRDARHEWSRKHKPLLQWVRERVEQYEQQQ